MYSTSILTVTSSLALLVSAQDASRWTNLTSFSIYGDDPETYELFKDAWQRPGGDGLYNSAAFTGYSLPNVTNDPGDIAGLQTNASHNWTLEMKTTSITVNDTNALSLVYSLNFGESADEGSLPRPGVNETDFNMCISFLMPGLRNDGFPDNITNIDAPNDGSCIPYFGEECYNELLEAWPTTGSGITDCASSPSLTSVPACRARFGSFDHGIVTSSILNRTDIDVYRIPNGRFRDYNTTWYNVTSDQPIPDSEVVFRGLRSGDPIATITTITAANSSYKAEFGKLLQFVAFSVAPSAEWRERLTRPGGNRGAQLPPANVRMVCARADANAEVSAAALLRLSGMSWSAVLAALLVIVTTTL